MALVQMKCPNCGGQMQAQGGNMAFKCPHCGTTVLNIIEAKLDSDVTIMTPEEYEQKANENKKSLVVKIDDKIEEIDVDTTVINKKIKQARESLNLGEWEYVKAIFSDDLARSISQKWEPLPSVNRLLLLGYYKVKDESELLLRGVNLGDNIYFKKIINSPLCDSKTKSSYQIIADECKNNIKIEKEIEDGYKLLQVGENDKFIAYAKGMCNKYPFKIKSWLMLAEAYKEDKEQLYKIYDIIKHCPEFDLCQECVVTNYRAEGVSFRIPESLKTIIYINDNRIVAKNEEEKRRKEAEKRAKEAENEARLEKYKKWQLKHDILVSIPLLVGLICAALTYFLSGNEIFSTYIVWAIMVCFGLFVAVAILFAIVSIPSMVQLQKENGIKIDKDDIIGVIKSYLYAIVSIAIFALIIYLYITFCK